jgi:hypothetical protein
MVQARAKCLFQHAASVQPDPRKALAELHDQVDFQAADALILFASADYNLDDLARLLSDQVDAPVLCCTTAGEISGEYGYTTGGIAAAAIHGCRAKIIPMAGIARGAEAVNRVLPFARDFVNLDAGEMAIGLFVVDGLSRREEEIIGRLQSAMPTVPLVGGSAGDTGRFRQTHVLVNGAFQSDAAAVMLIRGEFSAIPFQTHHFTSSGIRVVATEVECKERRVIQLDGMPATQRLARVTDCRPEEISIDWLARRPLMLKFGDSLFVRSAQSVQRDGSLSMLCAIHKGEILHIGSAGEITDTTGSYFEALLHQHSAPDLILGFDCILRRLELELRGRTEEMNAMLRRLPFVGFSTFGEQFHGQHVNQTMTGVALWTK